MSSHPRRFALAIGATALAAYPTAMFASSYIVHPGDTLRDIAVRHATTVEAIAAANNLTPAPELNVGQFLAIPDPALLLPAYALGHDDLDMHTVAQGESVFRVAQLYGIDSTALARTNGIGVNATLAAGALLAVPGRLGRLNALLTTTAIDTHVSPAMVRAVGWLESGWDQHFTSPTGAVGIMQIEPSAGEWISHNLAHRQLDIHRADDNVLAGSLLLGHLSTLHGMDSTAALGAYYQGEGALAEHGMYADTRHYVNDALTLISADEQASPLFAAPTTL